MNKILRCVFCVAAAAVALAGCASTGRGHGPAESFAFLAAANPQLPRGAIGAIDESVEPKVIQVVVPPGTDMHGLVATFSFRKEAVVTVVSSGTRVVQSNGVTPNDFSVPVTYAVETAGEKKPWTYRVTVREAQTNARLSVLAAPSSMVMSPGFSPAVHAYTLDVPFATTKVRIEARSQSTGLRSVTIDGTEIAGSSATGSVDFQNVQERTITVATLAEDGVGQEQYTVLIRRGLPDSNAFLDSLDLVNGQISPVFTSSLLTYQAVVPFESTQLLLKARPQSRVSTISLSAAAGEGSTAAAPISSRGDPAGSGAQIGFSGGDQLALIIGVTAEDGSLQQYSLFVVRAPPERNAFLSGLALFLGPQAGIPLNPPFNPGRFSYMTEMPYATARFTVRATPQSRHSSVAFEALPMQSNARPQLIVTGAPGSQNGAVVEFPAAQRRLLFALAVTAQDGSIQRTIVEVRRAALDANADLGSLSFSVGAMSPTFSPRAASYSLAIPGSADSVVVTAGAASPLAAVAVAEQPGVKPATTQALTITVAPGASSVVTFVVTAQDGSQKLYRMSVSREAAPVPAATPAPPPPVVTPAPTPAPAHAAALPALPADTGTDRVMVAAKNLKLQAREAAALASAGDQVSGVARITIRYYRSTETITQFSTTAEAKMEGAVLSITLAARSNGMTLKRDRLVEVETAVRTKAGKWLFYTEARMPDSVVSVDVPFLLYGDKPSLNLPAIGSKVPVAGYFSSIPLVRERAADKEDFGKGARGDYSVTATFADAKTGAAYGSTIVTVKTGQGRDRLISFATPVLLPEGAAVKYVLTATAKNGKLWSASGTTQAWTVKPQYPAGFQPALVFLADELAPQEN
jgi:hypothetical protein